MCWGTADLFYKKGAAATENYTHIKTAVMVGLVMGAHAIITLIFKRVSFNPLNLLIYLPVSFMYILSMIIGYYGLRYLELSICSPVQNSSGAVTCILCIALLKQMPSGIELISVCLICIGVMALGIIQKKQEEKFLKVNSEDKKYRWGARALIIPVIYCVIDALGTFFDAYYLDDFNKTPLKGVTQSNFEDVANISYELTFLIVSLALLIYLIFIKKEKFTLSKQKSRAAAAIFETLGQATYVFAMSANAAVAAPVIASYSIASIILSRIFLKEKLSKREYAAILPVMAGILLLGISEGA